MESFETTGYFWLPAEDGKDINEVPPSAVPGTLTFAPASGGTLELMGMLGEIDPFGDPVQRQFPLIQGLIQDNKARVSLTDCYIEATSVGRFLSTMRLTALCAYRSFDSWLGRPEEVFFRYMAVGFTYLHDWMFPRSLKPGPVFNMVDETTTAVVNYEKPRSIETEYQGTKLRIVSNLSTSWNSSKVSVHERYSIKIVPEARQPISWFRQLINFNLAHFFTFATGCPNYPMGVSGVIAQGQAGTSVDYLIQGYTARTHQLMPHSMLFSYDDVSDELPQLLGEWMSLHDRLKPVLDLYFSTEYERAFYLEVEFLTLSRALEGFHRIVCGGSYMDREEYELIKNELIARIPQTVKSPHQAKLRGLLEHGFEYSLRKRLKELCQIYLADKVDIACELVRNPDKFVGDVVDLRNRLTHPDVNAETAETANDIALKMFFLNIRMKFLLRICLLVELGFNPQRVKRMILENHEYRRHLK